MVFASTCVRGLLKEENTEREEAISELDENGHGVGGLLKERGRE